MPEVSSSFSDKSSIDRGAMTSCDKRASVDEMWRDVTLGFGVCVRENVQNTMNLVMQWRLHPRLHIEKLLETNNHV